MMHAMFVKTLKTRGFRNLKDLTLRLPEVGVYVLYGANGAGKTNVLEALSLLSPGQGLHRAKLDEITQEDHKQWSIFADLENTEGAHKLGMLYSKKRRHLRLDGEDLKQQAELARLGSVLWFTPEMDQLFKGSPAARRRFFDRLVFSQNPLHATTLSRYTRHIQNRAKLLKSHQPDPDWLTLEEAQAAKAAVSVVRARHKALQTLTPFMPDIHLSLKGSAEAAAELEADDALLEKLYTAEFATRRGRDKRTASTSFGPHRSDVTGTLIGVTPLERASMGQHKKAMLLILFAAAHHLKETTGTAPCLLLDEVATHLDEGARDVLYEKLIPLGGHVWLTGTEKNYFSTLQNPYFISVDQGQITPEF